MALDRAIPWPRLVLVEVRKAFDTRGSIALYSCLVGLGLANVITSDVTGMIDGPPYVVVSMVATAIFLVGAPAVGLLAATSEWAHRTAAATFLIEPRRWRVLTAQGASALMVVVGLLTALVLLGLAAEAPLRAGRVEDSTIYFYPNWAVVTIGTVYGMALTLALLGLAWGWLLITRPVSIVVVAVVLALPDLVLKPAFALVPGLTEDAARWVSATTPLLPLEDSGRSGAEALTSFVLWYLVPLILGFWRQSRHEPR
ncbi:MAG: hypothetical protein LBK95_12510 [Bifidobacteriaceae bacterium]|nr:hypothetical protein [Bifidobacteriaceae bacterium]